MNTKYAFILLLVFIIYKPIYAKKLPVFTERKEMDNLTVDSLLSVSNDLIAKGTFPTNSSWKTNMCYKTSIGRVILGVKNIQEICPPAIFELSVRLRIKYLSDNNNIIEVDTTLSITYNNQSGSNYTEKAVYKTSTFAHSIEVKILSISNPNLRQYVYLETQIEEDRSFCNLLSTDIPKIVAINYIEETDEIEVVMDSTLISKAEYYELEWTFEEGFVPGNLTSSLPTSSVYFDFRRNSSRIQTSNYKYRISNIFENGYIIFRARIKGYTSNSLANLVATPWSTIDNGQLSTLTSNPILPFKNINSSQTIKPHEQDLVWQYSCTYAEEGKKKDIISYFDGIFKSRQTVTRSNTDSFAIVAEAIYDHLGREAVKPLPAPSFEKKLRYYHQFNVNTDGKNYNFYDFEITSNCEITTEIMDSTSGASGYYSSNNSLLEYEVNTIERQSAMFIPKAYGYPFVQTEFMPDQTGRPRRQSGVGISHRIGSGKETKYYYATPFQEEIDRLFGNEVGNFRHYKKNLVVDPNGQASISYLDAKGRVIATGLAGVGTNNTQSLNSNLERSDVVVQLASPEDTLMSEAGVVISKLITVSDDNSPHKFKYSLIPEKYVPKCNATSICYDCVYDLNISIINECGEKVLDINRKIGKDLPEQNVTCNESEYEYSFSVDEQLSTSDGYITINLNRGAYQIIKSLNVNKEAIEYYLEDYKLNRACRTYQDFLNEAWKDLDSNSCFQNCDSCNNKLGTEANYVNQQCALLYAEKGTLTSIDTTTIRNEYLTLKANCDQLCAEEPNYCETYLEILKQDVRPGGQYAKYAVNSGTGLFEADLSGSGTIYNLFKNPTSSYSNGFDTTYKNHPYFVNNGAIVNGSYKSFSNMTVHELINNWEDTLTNLLVKQHPEYCKYVSCKLNDNYSDFDQDFLAVETYNEAFTKGYLNPISTDHSTLKDPYFLSGKAGFPLLQNVRNRLNTYKSFTHNGTVYVLSIWDIAISNLFCNYATTDIDLYNCIQIGKTKVDSCTAYQDLYWKTFQGLYLSLRNKVADSLRATFNYKAMACNDAIINTSLYKIRIGNVTDIPEVGSNDLNTQTGLDNILANQTSALSDECAEQCSTYVESWKEQLKGCNLSSTEETIIITKLLEVCNNGCDGSNPFGSSTVSNANQGNSAVVFKNFKQVLTSALTSPAKNVYVPGVCDDILIKMPLPYNHNIMAYESPFSDTCACNESNSNCDTITVSNNNCPCQGNISSSVDDIGKNLLKYNYEQENQYKCNNCIDCENLNNAFRAFDTVYGNFIDSPIYKIENILEPFLNRYLNLNLSIQEYRKFGMECLKTPSTLTLSSQNIWIELKFKWTTNEPNFNSGQPPQQPEYTIDTCGCDKLIGSYLEFRRLGNSFDDDHKTYFKNKYHISGNLNSYDTLLSNCISSIYAIIQIDANFLSEGPIPSNFDSLMENWAPGQWQGMILNNPSGYNDPRYSLLNSFATPVSDDLRFINFCEECQQLCNRPINEVGLVIEDPCLDRMKRIANVNAKLNYQKYLDSLEADFIHNYIKQCKRASGSEIFEMKYNERQYHYTLYYYDQAGNLVKTVPPSGVTPLSNSDVGLVAMKRGSLNPYDIKVPEHTLATNYRYTTLNTISTQTTPDAGQSNFYYDHLGRLVASQNSKQEIDDNYSYTKYDNLGRIIEVGQIKPYEEMETSTFLSDWLINAWLQSTLKEQITNTVYDLPSPIALTPFTQYNLRTRVSYSTYKQYYGSTIDHSVYYSYDIAGNVTSILREVPALEGLAQEQKITNYNFDLISGKVNSVIYQPNEIDQYIHSYSYDADNRLTKVYSGQNYELIDLDAQYLYYLHGPLSRTELGYHQVQGLDYSYTVQGWLKGVNGSSLNRYRDIGRDGAKQISFSKNSNFCEDVYAFTLSYFQGDYYPIGSISSSDNFEANQAGAGLNASTPNLYNGNIRMMNVAIKPFGNNPNAYVYQYDQLNRLIESNTFVNYDSTTNSWQNGIYPVIDYRNKFEYDPNGNILKQNRYGNNLVPNLDSLEYEYYPNTNRLKRVLDQVTATNYSDDIDNQTNSTNYKYDAIGNLITDIAEEIDTIYWNVYGKISKIKRFSTSTKPDLEFQYTPDGHRAVKIVIPKVNSQYRVYTYYSRDAQGNILAVYERTFNKTLDYSLLSFQMVNDSLLGIVGSASFGTFVNHQYPSNSNLENYLQSNAIDSNRVSDILNLMNLNEYVLSDPQFVQTVADNLGPEFLINASLNYINNNSLISNFLDDLCNNGYLFTEYIMDNQYEKYIRALSVKDISQFTFLYESLSLSGYTDSESAINWILMNINPTSLRIWLDDHWTNYKNCDEKTAIILIFDNYNDELIAFLNTQTPYNLLSLTLSPNQILNALNEYSSDDVKTAILSVFNVNDIYDWYKNNSPQSFIVSTVTVMPKRISVWQNTNAGVSIYDYFTQIKTFYGQSVFDILLTKFLDKSNFYVDSINLTEWHMYGSSRLGIYSTTLNLAWQRFQASVTNGQYASITNTVLVVNEPSYNFFYLTRGKKRYELSNHLGNVLAVITDMKLYACHQYDKFVNFEDNPNILGDWNIRDSWEGQNAVISLANGKLNVVDQITSDPHARVNYITASHLPPDQTYKISFDLEQINGDPNWQIGIVTANSSTTYEANFTFFSASPGHNEITVHPSKHIWRIRLLHLQTAQDIEFNIDNFRIENLSIDTFTSQMADIVSATDYSPFGAPLPGRTLVTKEYRFRFNGKENDSETYGDGNALDFGARIYDSRLGRWMSCDPLQAEYTSLSPYNYTSNNPIFFVDPDGKKIKPGDNWTKADQKVLNKMLKCSPTFNATIAPFKGKTFDYILNKKSKMQNFATTYVNPDNIKSPDMARDNSTGDYPEASLKSQILAGAVTTSISSDVEFNDLGMALTIAHESIHAKKALGKTIEQHLSGNRNVDHPDMVQNVNREQISTMLSDYNKATKGRLSTQQVSDLSYLGLLEEKGSDAFVKDFSKRTWGKEITDEQLNEYKEKTQAELLKLITKQPEKKNENK
jgi:RHS repeat-associated protein